MLRRDSLLRGMLRIKVGFGAKPVYGMLNPALFRELASYGLIEDPMDSTHETLQALFRWVETLPAQERTLLCDAVSEALNAGTLRPGDPVRLCVAADGTYRLTFAQDAKG